MSLTPSASTRGGDGSSPQNCEPPIPRLRRGVRWQAERDTAFEQHLTYKSKRSTDGQQRSNTRKIASGAATLSAIFYLLSSILSLCSAQSVVLYRETFPYGAINGNLPVSSVAWAADIPDDADRLYQTTSGGGDGAVFAYEANPATTAFYTSTALTQAGGAGFLAIDSAVYSGITLSVDIQPSQNPANVTARFAVQINGSHWFVSATPVPVPASTGAFAMYSSAFNPAASQWDSLAVSGNGTGTGAVIGALSSSNLIGNITGAGMDSFLAVNGGTWWHYSWNVTP